jgi:hypothetical protein
VVCRSLLKLVLSGKFISPTLSLLSLVSCLTPYPRQAATIAPSPAIRRLPPLLPDQLPLLSHSHDTESESDSDVFAELTAWNSRLSSQAPIKSTCAALGPRKRSYSSCRSEEHSREERPVCCPSEYEVPIMANQRSLKRPRLRWRLLGHKYYSP